MLAFANSPAIAAVGKRFALVIGNSSYASIGALRNPTADGSLIARKLEGLAFETTLLLDAQQIEMKRAIAAFGRQLRTSGSDAVGLFFYAGHGIQAGGRNYLMPIEANPQDEADLDLVGVDAAWVLRQMESAGNRSNIVILDACRNNPLGSKARSSARGLARIDAPTGSFIAYATAPGSTAVDGDGANSPFTASLAAALEEPARPIEQIFKEVRRTVIAATNGRQTPWDSSSLVQDFYFAEPAPAQTAAVTPAQTVDRGVAEPTPAEVSLWQSVSKSGDPGRIALFLQLFPKSGFADEARTLMIQALATGALSQQEKEPAPAAPPTAAAPPPAPPAAPRLSEHEMIATAQASRNPDDYVAYISAYPDGVFVDLATAELEHLTKGPPSTPTASAKSPAPTATDGEQFASLTFDKPIESRDAGWARGLSLRDMARASPEFPPIDGLQEELWREKPCSNCHNWSIPNLCDQGKFYVKAGAATLQRKRHPFGGGFKAALAAWAKEGCR